MISVAEALAAILAQQRDFGAEALPLMQSAGRILAQDVAADRDFPPYDRVTMDGIAISSKAFDAGRRIFRIESLQPAGAPQQALEDDSHCIEVMTGAVLPAGADAVIPYENCRLEVGIAVIDVTGLQSHQNIHRRGTDSTEGARLLNAGLRITPAIVGILASVGMARVAVKRLPRIAVCSTGDELVDIAATPLPHQIRRSNTYMLAAALMEEGIAAGACHLPDEKAAMRQQLCLLMKDYDVLLLSGAVSKGRFDFLPEVLQDLGMKAIFHRVAQKPGKPFLFGKFDDGPSVFGFPGNPVSAMVCYRFFLQPWLRRCLQVEMPQLSARLATGFSFKPALTYHLPVTLRVEDGVWLATPCAGANSGDMVSLQRANGLLSLPADQPAFNAGESFPLTLLAPFF